MKKNNSTSSTEPLNSTPKDIGSRKAPARTSRAGAAAGAYSVAWITPDAYADLHGITRPTVVDAIRAGRIRAICIRGSSKRSYAIDPAQPWPGKLREIKWNEKS